ncbi:MAG TPA: hypothetical protein VLG14_05775, partial [Sphingomonas sp.]|nr:hypothetical protein [Sphingomonas sp.]
DGQNQRGPRANPAGDRRHAEPRGDRPQGERQARPEGQRQTLGASFGGREDGGRNGNGQRPQGDQPRFYGPKKKKWAPRPAGGQRSGGGR